MEESKKIIKLSETYSLVLKTVLFEDDIDMDRLLRVDVQNIHAEYTTLPVILNKVGLLLADCTEKYNLAKLDCDVTESQLKEKYYTEAIEAGEKLTEDKCKGKIINTGLFKIKKKQLFARQKEMEYINSLFWALKSKDDKINKMMNSINPEDTLDFLTRTKMTQFNYVNMKVVKPLIK